MPNRSRFFLPEPPDVLGRLRSLTAMVAASVERLAEWAATGDINAITGVVAQRDDADKLAGEIVDLVFEALITPIDREDVATLTERLQLAYRVARGLAREVEVLAGGTDEHLDRMCQLLCRQATALTDAVAAIPSEGDRALAAVGEVEAADRDLDSAYRAAMSSLAQVSDLRQVLASQELYRRANLMSQALGHTAHYVRYVVLKER